jgi:hypothetical protein
MKYQDLASRKPFTATWLVVSSTLESIPVTAAPAPAAAVPRRAGALWASLVHRQGAAAKRLTVQASDCPLQVLALDQLNKAESPRVTRHLVSNHHRRGHLKARIGHELVERTVRGVMGQITYEKFRHLSSQSGGPGAASLSCAASGCDRHRSSQASVANGGNSDVGPLFGRRGALSCLLLYFQGHSRFSSALPPGNLGTAFPAKPGFVTVSLRHGSHFREPIAWVKTAGNSARFPLQDVQLQMTFASGNLESPWKAVTSLTILAQSEGKWKG